MNTDYERNELIDGTDWDFIKYEKTYANGRAKARKRRRRKMNKLHQAKLAQRYRNKVENAYKNAYDYCVMKITNTDENNKSFCYYTDTFPKISDKRMFKRKASKAVRKTQGYLSKGNEYKKLYNSLKYNNPAFWF